MDKKTRGCLWAGLGGLVLLIVVGAALAAGLAWFVYENSSLRQTHPSAEDARARLARARERFAGQAPLVTIEAGQPPKTTLRDGHGRVPESLHVMAWEPGERELTELRLPFWLIRLGGGRGKISANGDALRDLEGAELRVEDIERAGPGLVLDHHDEHGRHVLIWTE